MSYFTNSEVVDDLKSDAFESSSSYSLKNKECVAVLYYAHWCPWCKKVSGEWEKFGKIAGFIDVVAFDIADESTTSSRISNATQYLKIKEELPNLISGFPTIVFYHDGKPVESYPKDGEREAGKFLEAATRICRDLTK